MDRNFVIVKSTNYLGHSVLMDIARVTDAIVMCLPLDCAIFIGEDAIREMEHYIELWKTSPVVSKVEPKEA